MYKIWCCQFQTHHKICSNVTITHSQALSEKCKSHYCQLFSKLVEVLGVILSCDSYYHLCDNILPSLLGQYIGNRHSFEGQHFTYTFFFAALSVICMRTPFVYSIYVNKEYFLHALLSERCTRYECMDIVRSIWLNVIYTKKNTLQGIR